MKWLKKITDKIGYTPILVLGGALLPLAVFGAGELLSFILANLGFLHLQQFAMTISTGLTWGVIWPAIIALAGIGLLIGAIIDITGIVSKKIKSYNENKKVSVKKIIGKQKSKVKSLSKEYSGNKIGFNKQISVNNYKHVDKKSSNNDKISSNQKDVIYKGFYAKKKNLKKRQTNFNDWRYHNNTNTYVNHETLSKDYRLRYKKNKNIKNNKSISNKNVYYRDVFRGNSFLSR